MYDVSVIVPVYNVAPYIERCAVSLFEQTLDSLEIIFVDDCTPDNSVEIINRVLARYPDRQAGTRIIKMPSNGGQAAVRRQGIIAAKGEYIIHCDGDDWVDTALYASMRDAAKKSGADVALCGYDEEFPGKTLRHPAPVIDGSPRDFLKTYYARSIHMGCWNKLVRRSLYADHDILPWPGLNMWEDNGLLPRLLYHAGKCVSVDGPVYHYNRMNPGAMTSGYGMKQVEQMLAVAANLADFFASKPDAEEYAMTVLAFKYLARINLITDSFANYRRYRNTYPESSAVIGKLDRAVFSSKGIIRYRMVRYGLAPMFILMFKLLRLVKH